MVIRNKLNTIEVNKEMLKAWQQRFPSMIIFPDHTTKQTTNQNAVNIPILINHACIVLERSKNHANINTSYVSFLFAYRHPETKKEVKRKIKSKWIDRFEELKQVCHKANQYLLEGKDPKELFDNFEGKIETPDSDIHLFSTVFQFVLNDKNKEVAAGKIRGSTLDTYKNYYSHLKYLHNSDVRELTTLYFQDKEISRNDALILNMVFEKAADLDIISKKPKFSVTANKTSPQESLFDNDRNSANGEKFTFDLVKTRLLNDLESIREKCPDEYFILEVLLHSVVRKGSALQITVADVDLENNVLNFPSENMKMNRPFRQPISRQLHELLEDRIKNLNLKAADRIYPKSENTLYRVYNSLPCSKYHKIHGNRALFKDFYQLILGKNPEDRISEEILSHKNNNKVVTAYSRTDYFEERRPIMQEWSDFLTNTKTK